MSEYCKYALDGAWFCFPDALPAEILAHDLSNGHIERKLSFALEDLYGDGQPAVQVGQELYGAGAAFVFAGRAFHNVEDAPFRLFCDYLPATPIRNSARSLSLVIDGYGTIKSTFSVVRLHRTRISMITLRDALGSKMLRSINVLTGFIFISPAADR